MRDFVYHHPPSLDEASQLALEEGAMLLAGGQTLLRDMKRGMHAPASLIDITGIVPKHVELHEGGVPWAAHWQRMNLPAIIPLPVSRLAPPCTRRRGRSPPQSSSLVVAQYSNRER